MNKVAMETGITVLQGCSNMSLQSQGLSCYGHCYMPNLLAVETVLSPQYGTIPWGDQSATWGQIDYNGPLPSWKNSISFLLE